MCTHCAHTASGSIASHQFYSLWTSECVTGIATREEEKSFYESTGVLIRRGQEPKLHIASIQVSIKKLLGLSLVKCAPLPGGGDMTRQPHFPL
jgi:hypothetical protein